MARIVCVDDYLIQLETLTTHLQQAGHEVWATNSGAEALDRIRAGEADLLVQDVLRPGMDGLEVLRALRSDPKWVDFPVIVVSGMRSAAASRAIGDSGADHHPFADAWLMKPLEPSRLILAVTDLLAARDARRPREG